MKFYSAIVTILFVATLIIGVMYEKQMEHLNMQYIEYRDYSRQLEDSLSRITFKSFKYRSMDGDTLIGTIPFYTNRNGIVKEYIPNENVIEYLKKENK